MTLGERIKLLRKRAKLTQEELAKEIGYSNKTSISKIESDTLDINQSTIVALARALKTTPCVIMGWEEPIANNTSNCIELSDREERLITNYRQLNEEGKDKAEEYIEDLLGMKRVYRAARSADNHPAEITVLTKEEQERIEKAPRVTSENSDL